MDTSLKKLAMFQETVEELYEYSENLISQGYDCYEKVQVYLKELAKKEQIKKEEDNGAR